MKIGSSSRCCKLFYVLNKHLRSHCSDKPEREGVQKPGKSEDLPMHLYFDVFRVKGGIEYEQRKFLL